MPEYYSELFETLFSLQDGVMYELDEDDEWEPVDWVIVREDPMLTRNYFYILEQLQEEALTSSRSSS